ncbi:MAG: histidine kinase [Lachnospiraceae bacterium]|jgi:two-component system sensor histidine kinase YesM|nr:histidine kinase [Lachnospiraceae bacterium]
MRQKNFSIRKLLLRYLLILLGTTFFSLLLFCFYSVSTNMKQIRYNNKALLNTYIYTLQSEMNSLDSFNQELCYDDYMFRLLDCGYYSDSEKIVYEYNLKRILHNQVPPYGAILIFDDSDSVSMYQFGTLIPGSYSLHMYRLKEELKEYWLSAEPGLLGTWQHYRNDSFSVLMNARKLNNLYVCSLIDLNHFYLLDDTGGDYAHLEIGFYDNQDILAHREYFAELGISAADLKSNGSHTFLSRYLIQTAPIEGTDISICCILPANYLWNYSRLSIVLITVIIAVLCGLILFTFQSINNALVYPLNQIVNATDLLAQNQAEKFPEKSQSNVIEFQTVNNALKDLIHQKISLEKDKQQEIIARDHAMLQYFQLQTRSHFLANCLKSLYSMLENKEYEKMQRMILAFSSHLRYIFHDNLKLVSLQDELTEVNDYYNIILMDRSKPVLLMQEVPAGLMNFRVPPLLIQTFLENSIKYNAQDNKLLCFNIHIETIYLENKPVIQIRLCDNGVGYSQEILKKINSNDGDVYEDFHVGISNLKKRVELIYKSGFSFAFYNEPDGGACSLIYLPADNNER